MIEKERQKYGDNIRIFDAGQRSAKNKRNCAPIRGPGSISGRTRRLVIERAGWSWILHDPGYFFSVLFPWTDSPLCVPGGWYLVPGVHRAGDLTKEDEEAKEAKGPEYFAIIELPEVCSDEAYLVRVYVRGRKQQEEKA